MNLFDQLEEIRARRAAITPGVWRAAVWQQRRTVELEVHAHVTHAIARLIPPNDEANQTFIAHAPADVDLLLAELDHATKLIGHLMKGGLARWHENRGRYEEEPE